MYVCACLCVLVCVRAICCTTACKKVCVSDSDMNASCHTRECIM